MALPEELKALLENNNGSVTSSMANEIGVSNQRLSLLVKSGDLEKVSRGVYYLPNEFIDDMKALQTRRNKMIYSHETALYFHDLTDRDPLKYSVTVPSGYNASAILDDGIAVFYVKKEFFELGRIKSATIFGNLVDTYNMERTICDCIRNRNQMDIYILTDALKRYVRKPDKDLYSLMDMASKFRIEKLLRMNAPPKVGETYGGALWERGFHKKSRKKY